MIEAPLPDDRKASEPRTLRRFAAICLLIFGFLFLSSAYRHEGRPTRAGWAAGILALGGVPGLIHPRLVRPVFALLSEITEPLGHVMSMALLAVVYYGFLTPLAFAFRIIGRDALGVRRSPAKSYWRTKAQPEDPRRYLRPYQRQ
jgi:hypothetical protein